MIFGSKWSENGRLLARNVAKVKDFSLEMERNMHPQNSPKNYNIISEPQDPRHRLYSKGTPGGATGRLKIII